jgi:hypothetical protein
MCGNPRMRVAVIAGTHAKEILTGLPVLQWIQANQREFQGVEFVLVAANLLGIDLFFSTNDWDQRRTLRYSPFGRDMNRLPADLRSLADSEVSEYDRVAELRNYSPLMGCDLVIDIHSTDGPSTPAGLGIVGPHDKTDDLFAHLGAVPKVYTDVAATQAVMGTKTLPHSAAYEPKVAVEIECGQTGTPEAPLAALEIFRDAARFLGILPGGAPKPAPKDVYRVVGSVMAPDESFTVCDERFLQEHAEVEEGELLLRNHDGATVVSPCKGQLIWCPGDLVLTASDIASEVWFIVQPA